MDNDVTVNSSPGRDTLLEYYGPNLWWVVRICEDALRPETQPVDGDWFAMVRIMAAVPPLPRAYLVWFTTTLLREVSEPMRWPVLDHVLQMDYGEKPAPMIIWNILKHRTLLAEVQKSVPGWLVLDWREQAFCAWAALAAGVERSVLSSEMLAGILVALILRNEPRLLAWTVKRYNLMALCAQRDIPPPPTGLVLLPHVRSPAEAYSNVPTLHAKQRDHAVLYIARAQALGWERRQIAQALSVTMEALDDVASERARAKPVQVALLRKMATNIPDELVYRLDDAAQTWRTMLTLAMRPDIWQAGEPTQTPWLGALPPPD